VAAALPQLPARAADDVNFKPKPVPAFEHRNDWKDHEDFLFGLIEHVRTEIQTHVELKHQQMAFSGIANYMLESATNIRAPWGDLYGETGEPPQSIVDRVMVMFAALTNGERDCLDISYPPEEFAQFYHALYSAQDYYESQGLDPIGRLGDAASNLACACVFNGARIGAHLTMGLMNAAMRNYGPGIYHPMTVERYRQWASDDVIDERFGK
jgi:hypothetical protein